MPPMYGRPRRQLRINSVIDGRSGPLRLPRGVLAADYPPARIGDPAGSISI
jgi:hypothetical protein